MMGRTEYGHRNNRYGQSRGRSRSPRRSDTNADRETNMDNDRLREYRRSQRGYNDRNKVLSRQKAVDNFSRLEEEEDTFVLKQMKNGALIRVKENRSKPIDLLSVNLKTIEADQDMYDMGTVDDGEFELRVPLAVIDELSLESVSELLLDIEKYRKLDMKSPNREFWEMMTILCNEHKSYLEGNGDVDGKIVDAVAGDIDRTLSGKSYNDLVALEDQIRSMLSESSDIDTDFWSKMLKELMVRKARARLEEIHNMVIKARVEQLQEMQAAVALRAKMELEQRINQKELKTIEYSADMDQRGDLPPVVESLSKYHIDTFLTNLEKDRKRVSRLGFIPITQRIAAPLKKKIKNLNDLAQTKTTIHPKDISNELFEKESSRIVMGNEELFNIEAQEYSGNKPGLLKPRYFNRVVMGYEWTRYNQAHYNLENPPPKAVQGYRFNIFYPELAGSSKAPSYRIIRDKNSKDTCVLIFQAPEKYQDIAFRIVNSQWERSSHRRSGFRSKFENGVLQLHFRFKKVFYRK